MLRKFKNFTIQNNLWQLVVQCLSQLKTKVEYPVREHLRQRSKKQVKLVIIIRVREPNFKARVVLALVASLSTLEATKTLHLKARTIVLEQLQRTEILIRVAVI